MNAETFFLSFRLFQLFSKLTNLAVSAIFSSSQIISQPPDQIGHYFILVLFQFLHLSLKTLGVLVHLLFVVIPFAGYLCFVRVFEVGNVLPQAFLFDNRFLLQ